MAMVASAVEWRGALSVTRDALDGTVRVCDADGRQLLRVFYASWEECDFVVRLAEAANAYPRLRTALDKALEACRLLLQSDELGVKAVQYRYAGRETEYEQMWLESAAMERQALSAAKEALEMAEGRGAEHGSTE